MNSIKLLIMTIVGSVVTLALQYSISGDPDFAFLGSILFYLWTLVLCLTPFHLLLFAVRDGDYGANPIAIIVSIITIGYYFIGGDVVKMEQGMRKDAEYARSASSPTKSVEDVKQIDHIQGKEIKMVKDADSTNRTNVLENDVKSSLSEKINSNNVYVETFGNGFDGLPWGYDSTKLDSSFNVIKVLDNSEIVIFQRRSKGKTVLDKVIADEVLYLFTEDKFIGVILQFPMTTYDYFHKRLVLELGKPTVRNVDGPSWKTGGIKINLAALRLPMSESLIGNFFTNKKATLIVVSEKFVNKNIVIR